MGVLILTILFGVGIWYCVRYEKAKWPPIIWGILFGIGLGVSAIGPEAAGGMVWLVHQLGIGAQKIR